ncbi:uncharacterized protein LOC123503863 isoform X8 [Portunus trituberculatus]|uniref:uncharacterized protein LOC123503863 isoform X8 n=1 Tax=Portunus trituberculatus TaxID=210409 RepID=UPI001E1CE4F6|nr:uncharacterized protein LOC123503863 isoform X8 [Portunus trituberculatus]
MKGCNKSHNFTSDEAYHTSDKDFTKDEAIHSSTPAAAKEDGRCNKQTTSVERTEDSWRERWGWASCKAGVKCQFKEFTGRAAL